MSQLRTKLAGGMLPLQDMIAMAINGTQEKLASAEKAEKEDKEKKKFPFPPKKEEKKDGEEEEKEKKSAAASLDFTDPDEIEKLASAMEAMGDELIKESDEKNIGKESPQGGLVLPTASPNSGKQNYHLGEAKTGKVPMHTPEKGDPSQGSAKTQVDNTATNPPGKTPYPAKGVLKVSAAQAIKNELEKKAAEAGGLAATVKKAPAVFEPIGKPTKVSVKGWTPGQGDKGKEAAMEKCSCEGKGTCEYCKAKATKEKSSSAVDFVLGRIKTAESHQGGLTLDTPSQEGPKAGGPAAGGNGARSNISSIESAIHMKKVQGKDPQKKMLDTVLTEKAQKKSTDPVLQNNLRNASSAGVKIAAAKAFLQKVAALDDSDPKKKALMEAMAKKKSGKKEEKDEGEEKKSNATMGGGSGGVAPMPGGSPTPNAM